MPAFQLRKEGANDGYQLLFVPILRNGKLDLESQIKVLDARISRTPQVERGLEALERDYENTRHKYQEMKTKQSQAELSKSLEEEQKGERNAYDCGHPLLRLPGVEVRIALFEGIFFGAPGRR